MTWPRTPDHLDPDTLEWIAEQMGRRLTELQKAGWAWGDRDCDLLRSWQGRMLSAAAQIRHPRRKVLAGLPRARRGRR
jgi:hypothetical protein